MDKYPEVPDLTIKVGDRVRSYDFAGVTTVYYEGYVDGIVGGYYRILVAKRVIDGAELVDTQETIFAPVNGRESIFGPTRGVVRLDQIGTARMTSGLAPESKGG